MSAQRLWLVRHGETEWSANGRHTGTTDLPLTERGERAAAALRQRLTGTSVARVLTSPLARARCTAEIAGYGDRAEVTPGLAEWNYGDYEGITTATIRETIPDWSVWSGPVPGGESAGDVAARLDRVIADVRRTDGDVMAFGHGHALRVLAARWVDEPPDFGRHLVLSTAALCCVGFDRESPAILLWNDAAHVSPD